MAGKKQPSCIVGSHHKFCSTLIAMLENYQARGMFKGTEKKGLLLYSGSLKTVG